MYIYNHINILLCIKKLVEDNNNFIYRRVILFIKKNKNQMYKIILHFNKLLLDKHFHFNNFFEKLEGIN